LLPSPESSNSQVRFSIHRLLYRDIKPENILVDAAGNLKLSDFGTAVRLSQRMPAGLAGTLVYMAPESFMAPPIQTYASDWWAVGMVLYECWFKENPVEEEEEEAAKENILYQQFSFAGLPLLGSDFLESLLIKDFQERLGHGSLGFVDVAAHPIFYLDLDFAE
jgi:serine/threonine protein kinase